MNLADAPSAAMAPVTPDLPGRLGVAVQMLAHAGKVGSGRADLTPTRLTALAGLLPAIRAARMSPTQALWSI